jgi:hypothetical protein
VDREISDHGRIKSVLRFFKHVYVFASSVWKQKLRQNIISKKPPDGGFFIRR